MGCKHSILSALIVLILLAAPLAIIAGGGEEISADVPDPGSTNFDGYTPIRTVQELSDIRNNLNGKYYLANDIFFEEGSKFTPIGSLLTKAFTGIFDGNGHIIDGLHTEVTVSSGLAESGLFGCITGAGKVSNLGVVNCSSIATSLDTNKFISVYAGGIVGFISTSASITNCYNTGSVSAKSPYWAYAGGILGNVNSRESVVRDCYNTGSVSAESGSDAYAGGIVGDSSYSASMTNCYNTGSISANATSYAYASGIIGHSSLSSPTIMTNCYNTGSISADAKYDTYASGIALYVSTATNCYNTGSISADSTSSSSRAGGITGRTSSASTITNCYNTGSISADSTSGVASVGGLVGLIFDPLSITNCYNTGSVSAASHISYGRAYAGGIIGEMHHVLTVLNCYNTGSVTVSSQSESRACIGAIVGDETASSFAIMTNCYYLAGMLCKNNLLAPDAIGPNVTVVDGIDDRKTSSPDQRSLTPKSIGDMRPTLSDAAKNNSIYFTGMSNSEGGWDFDNIWTIDESLNPMNDGLPVLRSLIFTASITNDPEDLTVAEGGTARFSASLSASPETSMLRYQWQVSADEAFTWTDLPGANGRDLLLSFTSMSFDGNLYRLLVTAPGHNDIPVESDPAKLTVSPSFNVSGRVSFNDIGLAGAEITYALDDDSLQVIISGADGNYSIFVPVGKTITITDLKLIGYAPTEPIPGPFIQDAVVDLPMEEKYFTVTGNINYRGTGLENAEVQYKINKGSSQSTYTDASGNYSITARDGDKITIDYVRIRGYAVSESMPTVSFATDDTVNFTTSIAYFTVSGKITHDGTGVKGIKINYTIDDGPRQTTYTGEQGMYSITAQDGKKITITSMEKPGYAVRSEPHSFTTYTTMNFTWTPDNVSPSGGWDVGKSILVGAIIGAAIGAVVGIAWYLSKKKKGPL